MSDTAGTKNLTSREAARLLGVSEASIKRWADGGLLPALKTAGGHRRFRPEDLAAFRRGAPAAREGFDGRGARGVEAARLEEGLPASMFELLVSGRDGEVAAALVGLHGGGQTLAYLADVLLCPALRRVGDLWQAGELSVAQEHIATRTALSALHALRASFGAGGPEGGPAALCCAVEDDFHELPVQLAALTLEARGWSVVNLGTSTPFYALSEAVARFRPRLVCVSSTVFRQTDRAAREYEEFGGAARRVGASIVLGGAGFLSGMGQRRFPADLYAGTFTQLEEYASALAAGAGPVT